MSNKIVESVVDTEDTIDNDEINEIQKDDLENNLYETEIIDDKKISGGNNKNKLMKKMEMKNLIN